MAGAGGAGAGAGAGAGFAAVTEFVFRLDSTGWADTGGTGAAANTSDASVEITS